MIFHHNQLMKTSAQLTLFLVTNPIPFERYEDHEAALYIHLHELIEQAYEDGEDPAALIEDYLGTTCYTGHSADELAAFLFRTGEMTCALNLLKENWDALDPSLPADSLMYGGASRKEVVDTFAHLTLRGYLEALTTLSSEPS